MDCTATDPTGIVASTAPLAREGSPARANSDYLCGTMGLASPRHRMSPGLEQTAGETMPWGRCGAGGGPVEEWTWQRGRGMRMLKIVEARTQMRSTVRVRDDKF